MDPADRGSEQWLRWLALAGFAGAAVGALALAGVVPARAGAGAAMALGALVAAGLWAVRSRRAGALAALASRVRELDARVESERKELAKKTRNLEALIAAVDEPLLATDNQRHVLLCNRSAEIICEAPPGGLVGRPIAQALTQAELLAMHDAACAGEVRRGRVRLTTPLGQRVYQVSAAPVPAAWGGGVFGAVMLLRDVTELDQAVQVKTDFVANASHELRTPVAAIRTAAETLETAAREDPDMAARVSRMIVSHAARLEELLRDLLDLSRLESADQPAAVEDVDLGEVRRQLEGLFEPVCRERGLRLTVAFDDDLEGLRSDRKLLMLILRNLVENATKFAFEGTEVRVTGEVVEEDDLAPAPGPVGGAGGGVGGQARGRGGVRRAVARFEVADRGIGIPLNQQDRVFERFYQVDPARSGGGSAGSARRGTGLGLAIVKHAAKVLGGGVGLESVWGQGTRVWVDVQATIDDRCRSGPLNGSGR